MAEIFTLEQLASFMQQDIDEASAELARLMATTLIRSVAPARYDALTDLSPLLPVALSIARRLMTNPEGLSQTSSQESIDDYSHSDSRMYGRADLGAAEALTASEEARVRRLLGVRGAHTITPYVPPPTCPPVWRPC